MTDFRDFTAEGQPLVPASGELGSGAVGGLLAGTSTTLGPFTVSQTSWELYLAVSDHVSAVAQSDITVMLEWSDSATLVTVRQDGSGFAAGPLGTPHVVTGRGPTAGDTLTISLANSPGSGDALDITWYVWEHSRVELHTDVRTQVLAGAGYTLASNAVPQGILFAASPAPLAGGASWSRLLPLYTGPIDLTAVTSSAAADGLFTLSGVGTNALPHYNVLLSEHTGADGLLNTAWALPAQQAVITATNGNAAAQTLQATGYIAPVRP